MPLEQNLIHGVERLCETLGTLPEHEQANDLIAAVNDVNETLKQINETLAKIYVALIER